MGRLPSFVGAWVAIGFLFVHGVGCRSGATGSATERCQRIREHLVELQLSPDSPDRELRAGLRRRALGDEFVASCTRSMTEAQRDCVLSASDSKSALTCSTRSAR